MTDPPENSNRVTFWAALLAAFLLLWLLFGCAQPCPKFGENIPHAPGGRPAYTLDAPGPRSAVLRWSGGAVWHSTDLTAWQVWTNRITSISS